MIQASEAIDMSKKSVTDTDEYRREVECVENAIRVAAADGQRRVFLSQRIFVSWTKSGRVRGLSVLADELREAGYRVEVYWKAGELDAMNIFW